MNLPVDLRWLFVAIGGLLVVATITGQVLARLVRGEGSRALIANLNERILAWWPMAALAALSATAGITIAAIAFALLSFLALREFISIVHTRRADQRSLFWAFFVLIPLQYSLVVVAWYGLFLVLVPVWAFIVFAIFSTLRGDQRAFLHRVAAIQWAVMVTIYFPSHIPYLLNLEIAGYDGWCCS